MAMHRQYPKSLWASNYVTEHGSSSGAYCHACEIHLTWHEYFTIAENLEQGKFNHHSCGQRINYGNTRPHLTPELRIKANDPNTYAQTWYHATNKSNWYRQIKNKDTLVHVGNKLTALAQADVLHAESRKPVYLYSFSIDIDGINTAVILKDDDHWETQFTLRDEYVTVDGDSHIHELKHTAYPYHNLFENPGNISVLTQLSNVNLESITVETLRRS